MTIDDKIDQLDKEFPLRPFTGRSMLVSAVRRMKAEKERNIPIARRSGFACSVKTGKAANKMAKREWEEFYRGMVEELRRDYLDSYLALFPEGHAAGKSKREESQKPELYLSPGDCSDQEVDDLARRIEKDHPKPDARKTRARKRTKPAK